MRSRKANLLALILFASLTLIMTYPTVFHMGTHVKDLGDPLLNTWIMAWNAKKILSLDVHDYFNANIFYPHKRTLAYSEHLFPQALAALPILLLSKNPIFAYNFVLLFSFLTSGFGMFLLARYLSKSTSGAFVAGIIYAFSPFMIAHLGHLQIITAGGIPLAFLFLHKFFKYESTRHLLLFTLFFLLQVLANGYYALYLSLFAGLYILLYIITENKYRDWRFWIRIAVFICVVLAVAGPFFRQYHLVRKEMGFVREIGMSANLTSFLATSPLNRIYGSLTLRFLKPEGELFPGFVAFMLAVFCLATSLRKNREGKAVVEKHVIIYSAIMFLSFLFTLGPKGPYILLYKFVPGFDGLRVASRFHILVLFSIAVLSAIGIRTLTSRLHLTKRRKCFVAVSLSMLILVEYLSIPIPMRQVLVKEDIPEIYRWLSTKENHFAIIELPLPKPGKRVGQIECPRLHYSTYHWKDSVNGYSGYFPPLYDELMRRWHEWPRDSLEQNIIDLEDLGVRYIIIHSNLFEKEELELVLSEMTKVERRVQFITIIGEAYIYELLFPSGKKLEQATIEKSRTLSKKGWDAFTNVKEQNAKLAYDGDISSRWETGPQRKGHFFELDLGQEQTIRGISLKLGTKPLDYPRGYRVEVSSDRRKWQTVMEEEVTALPITAFLRAHDLSLDVVFSPVEVRYIKITNTGEDKIYYWSIYEMDIFF